jgi:hypothetical protein
MTTVRNYDFSGHLPAPRVPEVVVRYGADGSKDITYMEVLAIKDAAGTMHHTTAATTIHKLDWDAVPDPIQIRDPSTNAPIPGVTMSKQAFELAFFSVVRADQLRRDAQAAAQQDATP